jgi:hypothetical protein
MCNQCSDIRRIHGEQEVWIIMKDRKAVMQFTDRFTAARTIMALAKDSPDAFWQIIKDSSLNTKWE